MTEDEIKELVVDLERLLFRARNGKVNTCCIVYSLENKDCVMIKHIPKERYINAAGMTAFLLHHIIEDTDPEEGEQEPDEAH